MDGKQNRDLRRHHLELAQWSLSFLHKMGYKKYLQSNHYMGHCVAKLSLQGCRFPTSLCKNVNYLYTTRALTHWKLETVDNLLSHLCEVVTFIHGWSGFYSPRWEITRKDFRLLKFPYGFHINVLSSSLKIIGNIEKYQGKFYLFLFYLNASGNWMPLLLPALEETCCKITYSDELAFTKWVRHCVSRSALGLDFH